MHYPISRSATIRALLLALAVAALGLWPHLRFSLEQGHVVYYKYAYDEEYYSSASLTGSLRPDRLGGGLAMRALDAATGHDRELSMVLIDAVLPFLAALAACFLAAQIVSGAAGQALVACLLLFGESFISLCASHVWPYAVTSFLARLMEYSTIFPFHPANFFSLFRTPDPQATFIWCFLTLGVMVRLARPGASGKTLAALAALNLLGPLFYFPCVAAVLLAQGLWLALLVWRGPDKGLSRRLLAVLACALAAFVLTRLLAPAAGGGGSPLTFASRLPVVTLSVVLSAGLAGVQALRLWRSRAASPAPADLLCLVLCAMPLLLLNQQLLTNRMVMTTTFEVSINAILLFSGAALLLARLVPAAAPAWAVAGLNLAGLLACLSLVVWAQDQSYGAWHGYNEEVRAALATVDQVAPPGSGEKPWIDGTDLSLIMSVAFLRPDVRPVCLYSQLFGAGFLANIGSPGFTPARDNPLAPGLYEHWLRNGLTPDMVAAALYQEADSGLGFYVTFFFSFMDSWKPFSLGRAVNPAGIRERLPDILEAYGRFYAACQGVDKTVLFLSAPSAPPRESPCLDVSPGAAATVGGKSIVLTVQRPRAARPGE
jgi:hypothetical protein